MIKNTIFATFLSAFVLLFLLILSAYFNRFELTQQEAGLPKFTHQLASQSGQMVPMRDGIKLHTIVTLPKGVGPWPSLLVRNPYDTMGTDVFNFFCSLFSRYGYACVYQEARGQMRSEGDWEPLFREPNDTTDTLNWMVEQSWMDGNIGMWGVSYLALIQWAGAIDAPPELKTFVPISMGTDFHKTLYEKGMFRHFASLWILLMPERGINIKGVLNFMKAVKHFPHEEIDEKYAGTKLSWYQEWIRDAELDSATWKRKDAVDLKGLTARLDIPLLMFDGWYDPFLGAEFNDYQTLASREKSRFIVGPWSHIQIAASALPVDESANDAIRMELTQSLDWFEHFLKGKPLNDGAYIQTYVMGANKWKKRKSWPPQTDNIQFTLANLSESNSCENGQLLKVSSGSTPRDERASEEGLQDSLVQETFVQEEMVQNELVQDNQGAERAQNVSKEIDEAREQISYVYDPNDPVFSRGGTGFLGPLTPEIAPGSLFQKGMCEREDVLSFTTPVFDDDQTIVGNIKLKLLVSTDANDTAFTAKLMDVLPDGRAVNIRDSGTTLALRNDVKTRLLYEPNSLVEVNIEMWPIEWMIKKGHRVRLDISSSNFPAYNIHSNYAGNWAEQNQVKIAKQTVYAPSILSLPFESKNIKIITESSETSINEVPEQAGKVSQDQVSTIDNDI